MNRCKVIASIMAVSMLATSLCACSKKEEDKKQVEVQEVIHNIVISTEPTKPYPPETIYVEQTTEPSDETAELPESMQPNIVQVRNICQLATLQVYFHNVAKSIKYSASGISGIGQMDRRFWFEYSGSVDVGINMSQVTMEITGNNIVITLPPAQIMGDIIVDSSSYNLDSVVCEQEEWYRRENPIEAADVTTAIQEANEDLLDELSEDDNLLLNAQERAKELIQNYINSLSAYTDVEYTITWQYIG